MLEQTKRIEALDVAKGIGIILVMIGHMTSSYLYNWIYSFHIPLFFILSGICFKNTKYTSFLAFARQRIKTLAIPTLTLYLIILSIEKIIGLKGYDLLQQLKGVHPDYLWFLITLFFSELFYYPLAKLSVLQRIVILSFSALLGVFFARNNITVFFDLTNVFFCTALYGLGNLVSPYIPSVLEFVKKRNKRIVFASTTLFFAIPLLLVIIYNESFNLSVNQIPEHTILYTLSAVGCSFAVIILSTTIPFQNILKFLGTNTLALLAFHPLISKLAWTYIQPFFHSHLLFTMIEITIVFLGSCAVIPIFNRYMPWAIGKRKHLQ